MIKKFFLFLINIFKKITLRKTLMTKDGVEVHTGDTVYYTKIIHEDSGFKYCIYVAHCVDEFDFRHKNTSTFKDIMYAGKWKCISDAIDINKSLEEESIDVTRNRYKFIVNTLEDIKGIGRFY
jgi:hypothetical protein